MAAEQIKALAQRVDELGRMCAQLSAENAELRGRLGYGRPKPGPVAADDVDHAPAVSRRGVLSKALGAAAVGVAGMTLLESRTPAAAVDGAAITAGGLNSAEHATTLNYDGNETTTPVLLVNDSVYTADDSGFAAVLAGWAGAVTADTAGPGRLRDGVYGYTDNTAGHGVVGVNAAGTGSGDGVFGRTYSTSAGGSAILGHVIERNSASTAVRAQSNGTGPGVNASSHAGRGGVFSSGAIAQLQLKAGSRASHPTAGNRGDLYVDKSGRLWFCKTGGAHATWKQLA